MPTSAASSTSRSARRSTRRPTWSGTRWPTPPTPPATRRPTARRPARGGRRLVRPPPRRAGPRPRRRAADDRLQGAGRLAADPARPRCGRRRRLPRGGLPDLRRRRAPRRRDAAADAQPHGARSADQRGTPKLVWLNSPSNPTGQVLPVEHLAKVVAWARQHGVVVASDECYAELDWRRGRGARLGPQHPRPARLRGQPRGPAGGLLAVQAVQPRRLPRRLRGRRPRAGRAGCSRSASTPA